MRISDWSSDVCSSDLKLKAVAVVDAGGATRTQAYAWRQAWTDGGRIYATWPHIKVFSAVAEAIVTVPLAARVAALMVKRDKQKGGPYWRPEERRVGKGGVSTGTYRWETDL